MGTSASITRKLDTDKYETICVNFDGYPEYLQVMLNQHYQDPLKIDALFDLGDLSFLDSTLDPPNNSFSDKGTVAYGRDRGEEGTESQLTSTKEEIEEIYRFVDYRYQLEENNWTQW